MRILIAFVLVVVYLNVVDSNSRETLFQGCFVERATSEQQDLEVVCQQSDGRLLLKPIASRYNTQSVRFSSLDASGLNLVELKPRQFESMTIVDMNLDQNLLVRLDRDTFAGISLLESLSISANKLRFVHQEAFAPVSSTLVKLNLNENKLSQASSLVGLSCLNSLKSLFIDFNGLPALPDLSKLVKLEELSVAGNKLLHLTSYTFANLTSLKYLNVNKNNIYFIDSDAFSHLTNLVELSLKSNYIQTIPNKLIYALSNLEHLSLSWNNIKLIPDYSFDRQQNIKSLILSLDKNTISVIGSRAFCSHDPNNPYVRVKKIYLSSNNLTRIDACIFRQMTHLSNGRVLANFVANDISAE